MPGQGSLRHPPRVEYEATEKTQALAPIFVDVYEWAKGYEAGPEDFGGE